MRKGNGSDENLLMQKADEIELEDENRATFELREDPDAGECEVGIRASDVVDHDPFLPAQGAESFSEVHFALHSVDYVTLSG